MKLNTFFKMSVLAAGMVAAMGANAEDTGNIQITGTLIASACQVDAASITAPVLLGDISSSTFSAVGDASAKEPFSIHITDCPEGLNNVMMVANGAKDATNEELVALDANSIATGVAVGIYNADDSLIKMGQTSAPVAISAENHDATINLKAAAVSTSDTITGGALSANTTFVLTYN